MVSRSHLPYLAMIVLGVVMIAVAVPELTRGEYTHEVESVSESEYTSVVENGASNEHTSELQNLSSPGQDAFLSAVDSNGEDSIAVTDTRAPDFRYGDTAERYYISFDGEYYLLTATGADQLGDLSDLIMGGVAFGGLIAIIVPGFDLWRHHRSV